MIQTKVLPTVRRGKPTLFDRCQRIPRAEKEAAALGANRRGVMKVFTFDPADFESIGITA